MRPHTATLAAVVLLLTGCQPDVTVPKLSARTADALAAAAAQKRTPFETFDFQCPGRFPPDSPGVVTEAGNTVHIRDIVLHSYTVSDNSLITGRENVWVDVEFNQQNGAGSFHGTLELVPTALGGSGTWQGAFGAHFKGGKFEGNPLTRVDSHMVLHGTGTLEGLTLMFDHLPNLDFAHPPAPFPGCEFDGEKLVGVIVDPRG
jgi:hypothetical protein